MNGCNRGVLRTWSRIYLIDRVADNIVSGGIRMTITEGNYKIYERPP